MDSKEYYKYINDYHRNYHDRITLLFPKRYREKLKLGAQSEGLKTFGGEPNMSAYVKKLVDKDLKEKGLLDKLEKQWNEEAEREWKASREEGKNSD